MKFTDRPKWKRIILAVICLIGLLAAAGGSFAAYTSQAFQRGVARNRDTETIRFTSNYLQSCANGTNPSSYAGRTILFSDKQKTSTSISIDLYVYNYANGNSGLVSQKDITYDLKVTFSGGNGDGNSYEVSESDSAVSSGTKDGETGANTFSYTITGKTLRGRAANFHKYTIKFPGSDIDKLKITAVATPQNVSVTNNQILAAVIAPCTGSETKTFKATGEFIDKTALPTEYFGFNYEISISSGRSEDATLTWKPAIVEIDKFFLEKLGKTDKEIPAILSSGKLTLTMDQAKGTGDYLIPFYIKDKNEIPASWPDMEKVITFEAHQAE